MPSQRTTKISVIFSVKFGLDETYIGGRRKGKRGRGAAAKTPAFGRIERNGKVIVEVAPNVGS
jgi:transposase-like protein